MRKQPQPIIKTLAVGGLAILIVAASPTWAKECIQWKIPGSKGGSSYMVEVSREWCDDYETAKYPCSCTKWKYEKGSASDEPGITDKIKETASYLNPKTWGDRVGNWLKSELDQI